MFESASGRESVGDAGEGDSGGSQDLGQIIGRGLAFHIGAEGEDDFHAAAVFHAPHQRGNFEVFGGNAVERREFSAKAMVAALERAGSFQRDHIGRLFNDAKDGVVAFRIVADIAAFAGGEEAAGREMRENIAYSRKLGTILSGSKKK